MSYAEYIFTKDERTIRKYDTNFILKQARDVLNAKGYQSLPICVNVVPREARQYTCEQASSLIQSVIGDSLYYGGKL